MHYVVRLLSNYAKKRGLAGIIIDGCVRDSYTLSQMDFPVYAKGITPNGPYKNGPGEMNFQFPLEELLSIREISLLVIRWTDRNRSKECGRAC